MRHEKRFVGMLVAVVAFCHVAQAMSLPGKDAKVESISLEGTWQFRIDPKKVGEKEQWFTQALDETVQLPGTMDENGKGSPLTTVSPRHLNRLYRYEGIAWYQKTVVIPQSWDNKRIVLSLERAHWVTKVWVDGKRVPGEQESLSVPHRYDLTDFLAPGEHTITVTVDNTVSYHLGGHSYSNETQTNWNGLTGRLELQATDKLWISGVQVFPNVQDRSVRIETVVGNKFGSVRECELNLRIGKQSSVRKLTAATGETKATVTLPLSKDIALWDDFSPALHTLRVDLRSEKRTLHTQSVRFGMREVSEVDKRVAINGVPVFLRGNVECCEFPLTGYPSAQVEDWKKMFSTFQEYGLNHVRFHSYTPTKAAFIAADELGIILETELPFWGLTGENKEKDAYLTRELDRILDEYGNHPSFVLMCMGNELNVRGGDFDVNERWVKHGQEKDPRHLYTASTSLFKKYRPTDEYFVSTRIRQIYDAGTDWDYTKSLTEFYGDELPAPVISHELGQWCVYPDFREMPKYTGILKPKNFEVFKKSLEDHHMGDQAEDFVLASGKLSALLYRHEMEATFRTSKAGGFQLLQLHDFPGQGTAPVGILNVFRESKGLIEPEVWRRSCDVAVPLLRFEKRTWKSSETFEGKAQFIHYRRQTMRQAKSEWAIKTDTGRKIASGRFDPQDVPNGELVSLGKISADLSAIEKATPLSVELTVDGRIMNDWSIWAYPSVKENAGDVLVTREWDDAAKAALNQGQSVLLMPKLQAGPGTIPAQFLPPFWSPLFKTMQSSTMGLLCDPEHPVFNQFPTDFHTDWQWFDVLVTKDLPESTDWMWSGFDTYCMVLDDLPPDYRPIIQPIDHFYRNKRLGLLLEGIYGKGKLMICCADLEKDTDRRIAAPHLKQSILSYMNSGKFNPTLEFTDAMFAKWFEFSEEPEGWKIKYVSTQHPNPNLHAESVLDGNPYSHWMNDNKEGIKYPHEIHFELPKPVLVKGFRYTPRQDLNDLGLIKKYEIYVTDHAYHWYTPVASGEFKPGPDTQVILFDEPKGGRNVRFVALEAMKKGERMATMAEFELITEELKTFEYVP